MTFEICAVNIQSCLAAERTGAHRIELCSALDVGGLTPSQGLIRAAVHQLTIPVNVLIRPREGHFCYSDNELDIMLDDIRFCHEAGAHGVVVGALTADHQLDLPKMQAMQAMAGDMEIVCHRAFDFTGDPAAALEQLIAMGYHRVLSSGQSPSAYEGRFLLRKMVEHAADRISVMPGAGISADNIADIAKDTGAQEFHFTGKTKVSGKADIPGLESWYWESDENLIREIMAQLG
ncbi:MAG: copper homeostasis protein CutC [Haliscomenobacteraceae bacterium CHB4]|nr:Copper homeostasis protein CutC [Saprospiraceae bacterium]MCE7923152.1 copper homeostasis protein CutC [Haliscomenobacteraceae bacterium CHB4]